ncbi:hypothetical protein SAMN04488029_1782 [Reichenbachiella faecimaris]|uniref:Uncharacterized protein n=1 Tax=Reichenbachiella faecimaris TaxID=692418 RepID=A0A1W2GBJ5_REIFA|nr:hypothetical protein [Reichenbachiella faecimaris]SMD33993.1 hypothetical protein SAMN04488029_1782 [Reichenbachiella faecimaris]
MKKSSQVIPTKREQLLSKERQLAAALENEATEVESKLASTLKTLAVISAGVLAVTILFKVVAPESTVKTGKKKKIKETNGKPSPLTASVISIGLQKLIPLVIEKFFSLNSKKT